MKAYGDPAVKYASIMPNPAPAFRIGDVSLPDAALSEFCDSADLSDWAPYGGTRSVVAADTTFVKMAGARKQSCKVTSAGIVGNVIWGVDKATDVDLSAVQGMVRVYIHEGVAGELSHYTNISYIRAQWTFDNNQTASVIAYVTRPGWYELPFVPQKIDAVNDWATVKTTSLRCYQTGLNADSTKTPSFTLDSFEYFTPGTKKYLMISFDDEYDTQQDAFTYLASLGLRATAYVYTRNAGRTSYLSWARLRELSAMGHLIGNHTGGAAAAHPHWTTHTSYESARNAVLAGIEAMYDNGLMAGAAHFATPGGHYMPDWDERLFGEGLISTLRAAASTQGGPGRCVNPLVEPRILHVIGGDVAIAATWATAIADLKAATAGIVNVYTHGGSPFSGDDAAAWKSQYDAIATDVAGGEYEVITPADLMLL